MRKNVSENVRNRDGKGTQRAFFPCKRDYKGPLSVLGWAIIECLIEQPKGLCLSNQAPYGWATIALKSLFRGGMEMYYLMKCCEYQSFSKIHENQKKSSLRKLFCRVGLYNVKKVSKNDWWTTSPMSLHPLTHYICHYYCPIKNWNVILHGSPLTGWGLYLSKFQ